MLVVGILVVYLFTDRNMGRFNTVFIDYSDIKTSPIHIEFNKQGNLNFFFTPTDKSGLYFCSVSNDYCKFELVTKELTFNPGVFTLDLKGHPHLAFNSFLNDYNQPINYFSNNGKDWISESISVIGYPKSILMDDRERLVYLLIYDPDSSKIKLLKKTKSKWEMTFEMHVNSILEFSDPTIYLDQNSIVNIIYLNRKLNSINSIKIDGVLPKPVAINKGGNDISKIDTVITEKKNIFIIFNDGQLINLLNINSSKSITKTIANDFYSDLQLIDGDGDLLIFYNSYTLYNCSTLYIIKYNITTNNKIKMSIPNSIKFNSSYHFLSCSKTPNFNGEIALSYWEIPARNPFSSKFHLVLYQN